MSPLLVSVHQYDHLVDIVDYIVYTQIDVVSKGRSLKRTSSCLLPYPLKLSLQHFWPYSSPTLYSCKTTLASLACAVSRRFPPPGLKCFFNIVYTLLQYVQFTSRIARLLDVHLFYTNMCQQLLALSCLVYPVKCESLYN